jgi:hypothetical protein
MNKIKALAVAAGLVALTVPAAAHHSFAMFDRAKPMKLKGTVKEFQWVNPHTWIQFNAPHDGRVTEWSIEGRSPNVLGRRGWSRRTFNPGDEVTLTIYPLKDGRPGGAIISAEFADGRVINADTPTAVDTAEEGRR